MSGKYSAPKEILALKPKGTMIKVSKGKYYYVYTMISYKNKHGNWAARSGEKIGKIVEGIGFIPNEAAISTIFHSTVEYGQYAIVMENTKWVLDSLINVFNKEDAYRIYLLALMYYVNDFQSYQNTNELYNQSYLSAVYPTISMTYHMVSTLLENLGRNHSLVDEFYQHLIDNSSKNLAVDGHSIISYSKCNDLAQYGNKYKKTGEKQVNILMAYDINTSIPVFSRAYPGTTLDKTLVKDLFETVDLKNVLYVVDAGFYSESNIGAFSSNGNKYVIPLSSKQKEYKKIMNTPFVPEKTFVTGNKSSKSVIYYTVNESEGKKVIMYKDLTRQTLEQEDYKSKIGHIEKYTEEKYEEIKDTFGIIVLQTNLDYEPNEIYEIYKKRWRIETFYDYLKNDADFDTLNSSDYYKTQGLAFIMLVVGLINREFTSKILDSKTPVKDLLVKARSVKLTKKKDGFIASICDGKTIDFFKKYNIDLTSIKHHIP